MSIYIPTSFIPINIALLREASALEQNGIISNEEKTKLKDAINFAPQNSNELKSLSGTIKFLQEYFIYCFILFIYYRMFTMHVCFYDILPFTEVEPQENNGYSTNSS